MYMCSSLTYIIVYLKSHKHAKSTYNVIYIMHQT